MHAQKELHLEETQLSSEPVTYMCEAKVPTNCTAQK